MERGDFFQKSLNNGLPAVASTSSVKGESILTAVAPTAYILVADKNIIHFIVADPGLRIPEPAVNKGKEVTDEFPF